MVKVRKNVEKSIDEKVFRYIEHKFRQLKVYEEHLEERARALQAEEDKAERNRTYTPRRPTKAEVNLSRSINGTLEKLYKALDDAVEIADPENREFMRRRVRANLVYNEDLMFFEKGDRVLEECILRAKLLGLAYMQPQLRSIIIEEDSDLFLSRSV